GILDVADVGAKAQADARADDRERDVAILLELDAEAADEIGRALDTAKSLIDFRGIAEIVDKDHGLRRFGAGVVANRRALPEDLVIAGILRIEHALAVAQTQNVCAARILAQHVAVRTALAGVHGFDRLAVPL